MTESDDERYRRHWLMLLKLYRQYRLGRLKTPRQRARRLVMMVARDIGFTFKVADRG